MENKTPWPSQFFVYALAGFLIFSSGFLIRFGQEAQASKSWEYVMPDGDDLSYWSYAKGRMMTPRCDGNPFYYEERGTRHAIPFTTAEITGLLAKYTHIPLSWFFPAWHILMPFFVWLVMVICCWKLWGYSLETSAAGMMLVLLSTLFYPWPGIQTTLFRFSRPMDGIALLFIWVSLILKGDSQNKKQFAAILLVSAMAVWLQPFYAVFGLWITAVELGYRFVRRETLSRGKLHLAAMISAALSGCFYFLRIFSGKNINQAIIQLRAPFDEPGGFLFLASLAGLVLTAGMVFFFLFFFRKKATALDRLFLEWTFFGFLLYAFPFTRDQAALHMFYFVTILIALMAGWIHEKINILKETPFFSWFHTAVFFHAAICCLFLWMVKGKNPLGWSPHYFVYSTQYFVILLFVFWLLTTLDFLKKVMTRGPILSIALFIVAMTGYVRMPLYEPNRDFPFDGAYQWLRQNAQKEDVVLTASLKYRFGDYLFLKTGLKSYFNEYGKHLTRNPTGVFRTYFLDGLLLNRLELMPISVNLSFDQKLRFYKLDYILMPLPSPFYAAVTSQLQGRLELVYRDSRCLLWKVQAQNTPTWPMA